MGVSARSLTPGNRLSEDRRDEMKTALNKLVAATRIPADPPRHRQEARRTVPGTSIPRSCDR